MPTKKQRSEKRTTFYDGEIHKCPNCGATLQSFAKFCTSCGHELRGIESNFSVNDFANEYMNQNSLEKKIDLIRTFAIPNTKEDLLEFFILAYSNISEDAYVLKNPKLSRFEKYTTRDVSEAWISKFDQAYLKATIMLQGTQELIQIEKMYQEKKSVIKKSKFKGSLANNKKLVASIILGVPGLLMLIIGGIIDATMVFLIGLMICVIIPLIWMFDM